MSRQYVACRLLELGPLSFREFAQIAGWPDTTVRSVLSTLRRAKYVKHWREPGTSRYLFGVVN